MSLTHTLIAAEAIIDSECLPGQRPAALAEALRHAWPEAGLCACLLAGGGAVVDGNGQARPDWETPLRTMLARGTRDRLPADISLPGQLVVARPLAWCGREHGHLALAMPVAASGDTAAELDLVARALAAGLAAAELRDDLAAEAVKADVGELAGPLIHDFSNLLNNLLLNLMVLEQGGADLTEISLPKMRARAEQVTALIKEVQEYRRRKPVAGPPADLNAAAGDAVKLLNSEYAESIGGELPVALDLAPDLPAVAGARTDFVRCLVFLLKSAARAGRLGRRPVRIRSMTKAGAAALRIEVRDLHVPVDSPPRLYDTLATLCPGLSSLELATAKSIARRFNGKLSADCPPDIGLTILLEVPTGVT